MGARGESIMVEKAKKVNFSTEWKTFKVPKSLWVIVKTEAAKKGIKIYEELRQKYD